MVLFLNIDQTLKKLLPLDHIGRNDKNEVFWGMLSWIQTVARFLGSGHENNEKPLYQWYKLLPQPWT